MRQIALTEELSSVAVSWYETINPARTKVLLGIWPVRRLGRLGKGKIAPLICAMSLRER